jgi:hypothetical protein
MYGMPSGAYTMRMTLAGTTVSQPLQVVPDPRAGSTPAAEREHAAMVVALVAMTADIANELNGLRDVRAQARALAERAKSAPVTGRDAALEALIAGIDSLEAVVVNAPGSMGDPGALDVMSIAPRLNTDVAGLLSAVEGRSGPVTSGEREQLARLRQRAAAFHAAAERVMGADVERVNALLTGSGLAPAIVRKRAP